MMVDSSQTDNFSCTDGALGCWLKIGSVVIAGIGAVAAMSMTTKIQYKMRRIPEKKKMVGREKKREKLVVPVAGLTRDDLRGEKREKKRRRREKEERKKNRWPPGGEGNGRG